MNQITAFIGSDIFDGYQRHSKAILLVQNERVSGIVKESELSTKFNVIKLDGGMLAPGFVDLQVNGGGGLMFNDSPTAKTIQMICHAHAKNGTTSLLPTLITDTKEITKSAINGTVEALSTGVEGVIGLHLEGPHLSKKRAGAHDPHLIRIMEDSDCSELESLAKKIPSLFLTVSPDSLDKSYISRLKKAGAIVSLGHTNCQFSKAVEATQSGASSATHLFNAMGGIEGRDLGLAGAALELEDLSASIIADGFHLDVASIRFALRAKRRPGFLFLVSDSMATTGSNINEFKLNGRLIRRQKGRLTLEDGTLAGADIDLAHAVRFMVNAVGVSLDEALRMATLLPSRLIGKEGEIGCLTKGAYADFVWLTQDLQVAKVWRRGKPIR
ncbi:MAG: N-acetylglucosamine-6-phosphate deacetylase [Rhodobacteraceae bacterium]|nr:N-acetylglucosamine-6-phosphate deacetylase [Paracoccaceae bacterium]